MNIEITPEQRQEIVRALIKLRAPSKVAKKLGYDLRDILPIADELAGLPRVLREETNGGYGRPELRNFLIGRKRAHEVWNNEEPAIKKAREDFELGTIEMTTGRDGDWLLLYAIPRVKPDPKPLYFAPEW